MNHLRLGVNIDHVATLRNARGGVHPCPVAAALAAMQAGADGITAHLREDRRHIRDEDMRRLRAEVALPLNFEMAATAEMQALALEIRPHAVCLVPEKRAERTTEGGLDVASQIEFLRQYVAPLSMAGIRVSLFIDPVIDQVEAAAQIGAPVVELHTGAYAELGIPSPLGGGVGWGLQQTPHSMSALHPTPSRGQALTSPQEGEELQRAEFEKLHEAAKLADSLGIEVHAGHGLRYDNVAAIAAIPQLRELNIGHFLIGEAVFDGLAVAIQKMRVMMDEGRFQVPGARFREVDAETRLEAKRREAKLNLEPGT